MKKNVLLAMSIVMCCVMNYSCTSDFGDETVRPVAKRVVVQSWSPEVLQRARELGIIIVDEDRQWNNLTEDDVIFYLNLLTEKGDSAFTPAVTPQLNATGMLRRTSVNVIEDVGSTVHNYTYFKEYDGLAEDVVFSVYIDWTVNKGTAEQILAGYNFQYIGQKWKTVYFSGFLSATPNRMNVDYRLKGTVTYEREVLNANHELEMEYKSVWVDLNETAKM